MSSAMNLSGFLLPPAEQWVELQPVPAWVHLSLAAYLTAVGTAGCVGNALVLYIFLR